MKKNHRYLICLLLFLLICPLGFSDSNMVNSISSKGIEGRISLNLKGMDVVELLKTLADKGKMNLIVGNNVKGRVTMFLDDVDINDAFEIILAANDLAIDKKGDIIYVMTQAEFINRYGQSYGDIRKTKIIKLIYAKAVEVSKLLSQVKTRIGRIVVDEGSNTIVITDTQEAINQAEELVKSVDLPTDTVIYDLNYAKAADIQAKIQPMITRAIGSVQVDERTNKIIITDLKENLKKIKKLVFAFDVKSPQVLIDAKIVEITLNDRFKLGVDWEGVFKKVDTEMTATSNFGLASQGEFNPGAEILITKSKNDDDYSALVQALKIVGDTNVLSSPRITALNNQEAKILVGSSEPYATNTVTQGESTTTVASTLTFLDVGVQLFVTPTINKKGFVSMQIRPEVSSQSGTYTYGEPETTVPIVTTTKAETTVSVKDGNTIIIAGLISDTRSSTVNKIPILGDIPILGHAFRESDKEISKKELVIFLTPHIVSGENNFTEIADSYPVGEKHFTVPEGFTFERRNPSSMSPDFFKKKASKNQKIIADDNLNQYFLTIKKRIFKHLSDLKKDQDIKKGDNLKVSFVLYSDGGLVSVPLVTKSSNPKFTQVVQRAVVMASPFPKFPESVKLSRKSFSLDIVYDPEENNKENEL